MTTSWAPPEQPERCDWREPARATDDAIRTLERTAAATATCTACALHLQRNKSVFGAGHANAALMFVGEGPGPDEGTRGEPFTGRSGELLNRIIRAMGARRENVFLTNIVSCQLDESRQLLKGHVEACRGHLEAQIDAVEPQVIVALGSSAWTWFHRKDKRKMADVRGTVHRWRNRLVVPTYHPAFLLRMPQFKGDVWRDMQTVTALLAGHNDAGGPIVEIDESAWLPAASRSLFD